MYNDGHAFAPLTLTRTSNNYVTSSSFNRLSAKKYGKLILLFLNLTLETAMNHDVHDIEIGRINGISLPQAFFYTVAAQWNQSHILIMIESDGRIFLSNYSGVKAESFYRGVLVLWTTQS